MSAIANVNKVTPDFIDELNANFGALTTAINDWARPTDFGAKGDGTTDDTDALNRFFAYVAAGNPGDLGSHIYNFSAPLIPIAANMVTIYGGGACLRYVGTSASPGDLVTFGDGTTLYQGLDLRGWGIGSSTTLSAGTALRIKKSTVCEIDLNLNGPVGSQENLFDCLWLDGTSGVNLHSSRLVHRGTGLKANDGSELHCGHATIIPGVPGQGTGMHIGGGYGGVYTENVSQYLANRGLLVDTTISAAGNQQFFLDGTFDGNTGNAVEFNDSTINTLSKVIYANAWCASSANGLVLTNWTGGDLSSSHGKFKNNTSAGLVLNDSSVTVTLDGAVEIADNGTYGVTASSAITINSMATPRNNTSGSYNSNVSRTLLGYVGKSAFYEEGTWTPTLIGSTTAGSQTYTQAVGTYTRLGDRVEVEFRVTISAKDAVMAGNAQIGGLPFAAALPGMIYSGAIGGIANVAHGVYAQFFLRLTTGNSAIDLWEGGAVSGSTNTQPVPVPSLAASAVIIGSMSYRIA